MADRLVSADGPSPEDAPDTPQRTVHRAARVRPGMGLVSDSYLYPWPTQRQR